MRLLAEWFPEFAEKFDEISREKRSAGARTIGTQSPRPVRWKAATAPDPSCILGT